jgi:hypothetical protein
MFIKAYHCPIKKHGNDARKDETEEDTWAAYPPPSLIFL